MDLCIKTLLRGNRINLTRCFNPCFNGSMYKNNSLAMTIITVYSFNPCFNGSMYKNIYSSEPEMWYEDVSILVLMDLCIKTGRPSMGKTAFACFNPCFNGSMYKNIIVLVIWLANIKSFNPCFNGSMYKNLRNIIFALHSWQSFNPCFNGSMYKNTKSWMRNRSFLSVSILVLMDLCIKTTHSSLQFSVHCRFNPCFNGSMYKNLSFWSHL